MCGMLQIRGLIAAEVQHSMYFPALYFCLNSAGENKEKTLMGQKGKVNTARK
jgi:hypothetical protein